MCVPCAKQGVSSSKIKETKRYTVALYPALSRKLVNDGFERCRAHNIQDTQCTHFVSSVSVFRSTLCVEAGR